MCEICERFGIAPTASGASVVNLPGSSDSGPVLARGTRVAGGAQGRDAFEQAVASVFGPGQACTVCGFWKQSGEDCCPSSD